MIETNTGREYGDWSEHRWWMVIQFKHFSSTTGNLPELKTSFRMLSRVLGRIMKWGVKNAIFMKMGCPIPIFSILVKSQILA